MHVAHLTLPFDYACGISRHVLVLSREQSKRHRVSVVTPGGGATELLDASGIPWLEAPIGPAQKNPLQAIQALHALVSLVRRDRVNVLHAHHRYPAFLARVVAALIPSVQAVATCHSLVTGRRRLSYPVKRVIAVSEATRRHLIEQLGVPSERISVVPNALAPIDSERDNEVADFDGIDECRPVLVGVGRLEDLKGFQVLVEAVGSLRRCPRPILILVGDGPARHDLEQLACRLGVEMRVTGVLPSPLPYLRRADVFVHPSLSETSGLAVAEAGLAGCAVICTNVGGLPELVRDGETGVLVPPQNASALARALDELLDDEARRRRLGAALREVMSLRADPQVMVEATANVYRSVAGDD